MMSERLTIKMFRWTSNVSTVLLLLFTFHIVQPTSQNETSSVWYRYNRYLGHSRIQNSLHRSGEEVAQWSSWSPWSKCSRSCANGTSTRQRRCLRLNAKFNNNGKNTDCGPEETEHKVCNEEKCPADVKEDVDKQNQCSLYNGRNVFGFFVTKWKYKKGGLNPCELLCLAERYNFQYSFGKLQDGSQCATNGRSGGRCLNGRCVFEGCDGKIGSRLKRDKCGICGGKNRNCEHVHDVFKQQAEDPSVIQFTSSSSLPGGAYGYKTIAKIPPGSTSIRVQDISKNYLALLEDKNSYIINGNWMIDRPGAYEVSGTKAVYNRTRYNETLTIDGPTKAHLQIMALMIGSNPGIHYEYWRPNIERTTEATSTTKNTPTTTTKTTPTTTAKTAPTTTTKTPPTTEAPKMKKLDQSVMLNSYAIIIPTFKPVIHPDMRKSTDITELLEQSGPSVASMSGETVTKWRKKRLQRKNKKLSGTYNKKKKKRRRKKKKRKHGVKLPSHCRKCEKVKGTKENFCKSDFVLRIKINRKVKIGSETRHEATVMRSYKNIVPILAKEFIWVPNDCHCPNLRRGKQYLVMGNMQENFRNRESRLIIDKNNYVRRHNNKNVLRVLKIKRRQKSICRNVHIH